jgi:hypothetical protein
VPKSCAAEKAIKREARRLDLPKRVNSLTAQELKCESPVRTGRIEADHPSRPEYALDKYQSELELGV